VRVDRAGQFGDEVAAVSDRPRPMTATSRSMPRASASEAAWPTTRGGLVSAASFLCVIVDVLTPSRDHSGLD
jgi:hypothetical protein